MLFTCRSMLAMPFSSASRFSLPSSFTSMPPWYFQRADGGDQHHRRRLEAGLAALDVDELLRPQVGAEARLGHHVVGELQPGLGREHRVAAVRDVGERAAVD